MFYRMLRRKWLLLTQWSIRKFLNWIGRSVLLGRILLPYNLCLGSMSTGNQIISACIQGWQPGIWSQVRILRPLDGRCFELLTYSPVLLLIHRNFFARAMIDFPDDPMQSVFAPSIIASYRSASYLIRLYSKSYQTQVSRLNRIWYMWAKCVSCSVCFVVCLCAVQGWNLRIRWFLQQLLRKDVRSISQWRHSMILNYLWKCIQIYQTRSLNTDWSVIYSHAFLLRV